MATIYTILKVIHIFSAIIGLGPGFVLIRVVKGAKSMTELKHAYAIRNGVHIYTMIGGSLLLVTGLLMGAINPIWFHQGWYMTGLILFLIALAMGPFVLAPCLKPIKSLFASYQEDEIPQEYYTLSNKLFRFEYIENTIFLIIIALMILKPF